jgi:hypothetical protein
MSPDRVIEVTPGEQPELPDYMPGLTEDGGDIPWPSATVQWWRMWRDHPIAKDFTDSDWSYLLDTALLHGAYWRGDLKQGAELRQRVAKFGATPEDRARLRISYAVADKSEREAGKNQPAKKPTTRKKKVDPRSYLTVVQDGS